MPEYDPAALQGWQRRMGPAGLQRVIATLAADAPRQARLLREAAARGDAAAVRQAAHAIKAPCGMFGAAALMQSCQVLEDRAADGALTDAAGAEEVARRFEQLAGDLAQAC